MSIAVGMLLDESGSMAPNQGEVIVGINGYVADLADTNPDAVVTLSMFDLHPGAPTVRVYCDGVAPSVFDPLSSTTYRPRGMTPLWDAIGATIKTMEAWIDANGKERTVLFVIQTDGHENSSREWTKKQVTDLIAWKEGEGWKFVFLGADMSQAAAEQQAALIGVAANQSMNYATQDSAFVYASLAGATHSLANNPRMTSADVLDETKRRIKKSKPKA